MAVNANSWKKFPVADRNQSFDADEAIVRIRDASSGNVEKFASAFLWRNSQGPANNVNSYRLPVVDVINGKYTLIPHAVFTAAAILSGAHGGLEGVVTDERERIQLKVVLTDIYAMLQKAYGDPRVEAPWLKGRTAAEREKEIKAMSASVNLDAWLQYSAQFVRGEKMHRLTSASNARKLAAFDASRLKTPSGSTAPRAAHSSSRNGNSDPAPGNFSVGSSNGPTTNTENTASRNAGNSISSPSTESLLNNTNASSNFKTEDAGSAVSKKRRDDLPLTTDGIVAASGESFAETATLASGTSETIPQHCDVQLNMSNATDSENPMKSSSGMDSFTASVNSSGWSALPIAAEDHSWSGNAARARVWDWSEGDFRRYRKAFLWFDSNDPELKGSYKLPVADVIDGTLTIVPRAVNAVLQVLAGARGGVDIPDDDMDAVQAVAERIQKRFDSDENRTASAGQDGEVVTAAGAPVAPPGGWFLDPKLQGPTPLAVTADGRIMGHLAAWGVCHAGITNQCVMAPHTAAGYRYFLNGTVLTADGSTVKVGKITLGTGHADTRLGYIPAADHYDNTGTAVGIVAAGEDQWGIWVAGALTPDATAAKAAELRRSPLSGDWRRVNGNLELVAALAVNTPGFPIVSMTAAGEPMTLCAAGVILEDGTIMAAGEPEPLPLDATEALARLAKVDKFIGKLHLDRRKARMTRIG